jgi:hypothetical protein
MIAALETVVANQTISPVRGGLEARDPRAAKEMTTSSYPPNYFMKQTFSYSLAAFTAVCLFSCNHATTSKVDHSKQDEQLKEIERLKAEVAIVEGKMKDLPLDRTTDIRGLEAQATAQTQQLQSLEAEISKVQGRKQEIEKEFEDYKRLYVIR